MPYLPPPSADDTQFPKAFGPDLSLAVRLLEERWRRFYPVITYTSLDKRVTAVTSPSQTSGEVGSTQFDTLWGESVPAGLKAGGWRQPHLSSQVDPATAVQAAEPSVYLAPRPIHGRIQRVARRDFLQKLGFDRLRDLIVTIPTSMLDASGITVVAGDRFTWDNELYEVIQWSPMGWWMNSSVKLEIVINAQHARRGA